MAGRYLEDMFGFIYLLHISVYEYIVSNLCDVYFIHNISSEIII